MHYSRLSANTVSCACMICAFETMKLVYVADSNMYHQDGMLGMHGSR